MNALLPVFTPHTLPYSAIAEENVGVPLPRCLYCETGTYMMGDARASPRTLLQPVAKKKTGVDSVRVCRTDIGGRTRPSNRHTHVDAGVSLPTLSTSVFAKRTRAGRTHHPPEICPPIRSPPEIRGRAPCRVLRLHETSSRLSTDGSRPERNPACCAQAHLTRRHAPPTTQPSLAYIAERKYINRWAGGGEGIGAVHSI